MLATQRVLADCGVAKSAIDGYVNASGVDMMIDDAVTMAEYLGIDHRWVDGTMTGGSSFEFHVQHAAAAIRGGLAETILITYGSDQLTRMGRMLGTGGMRTGRAPVAGPFQYEAPYGNSLVGAYAMAAQRHMHEFGTTSEQLAAIAVAAREFAQLNPSAMYRDPLTVEDVVGSRLIADPLHKLDCCVISDGGGAVILTTAERARDLRQPPVYVLGAAGAQTHWNISQMPDFTETAGARIAADLFARAGVTPADIDTVQLYDSFTITVLLLLEDLGFCPKGEGGPWVAEGHIPPRRLAAAEHRRRRAVVEPSGHARHLPAHRGGAAAARSGGRGAGARLLARARLRLGRLAVVHRRRDPGKGQAVSEFSTCGRRTGRSRRRTT